MAIERRRAWLRGSALLCLALILAVTTLSAFVRLSNAGPGCEPWPQCFHERATRLAARAAGAAPESEAVLAARGAHRIAASSALLVVIALVALSLGPRPYLQREGRHALALLALVAFLAVLGRWSAGTVAPAITLGNLLGGFLLFAMCWRLALPAASQPNGTLQRFAAIAVVALLVQVMLGALAHPWHRFSALAVALVIVALAAGLWRAGSCRTAVALLALLATQLALGVAQFAAGLPLILVLAHNIVALLLLAMLLRVTRLPWLGDGPRGV